MKHEKPDNCWNINKNSALHFPLSILLKEEKYNIKKKTSIVSKIGIFRIAKYRTEEGNEKREQKEDFKRRKTELHWLH